MGCDIHWYSETKIKGQWVSDAAPLPDSEEGWLDLPSFPNDGRDYWFFGFLAGVRREYPYSLVPKGIPGDMSPEVSAVVRQWEGDGHSHSYLTRAELKERLNEFGIDRVLMLLQTYPGDIETIKHVITRLKETIENLSADVPDTDQRIVFFFDN